MAIGCHIDVDDNPFGSVLRWYRMRAGKTQTDVANAIGASVALVSSVESGTRSAAHWSRSRLDMIADLLGIGHESGALVGALMYERLRGLLSDDDISDLVYCLFGDEEDVDALLTGRMFGAERGE